jgi:hypothetical protein
MATALDGVWCVRRRLRPFTVLRPPATAQRQADS